MICAVSSCKVYGPFFFAEPTATDFNYLDMQQLWLTTQLQEDSDDIFVQQDSTATAPFGHLCSPEC
jgi:hypothetical protein